MTEITFKLEDGGFEFTAVGHSGYAEAGEDIICAAVSILSYTLGQAVSVMELNGELQEPAVIEQDEDITTMTICAKPKKESYAQCLYLFHIIQMGCHLLKEQAPEYVEVHPFTVIKPEEAIT